ncbi:hypothetical protein SAMN05421504_101970 [Amycolatopsis xylanica]|uniref:Uncharacterized protein n=1 Tax=Amycolatopsis xylanica TaxID=589385 RepID=A0A1H2UQZ9_9PSEU|nr:GAF domain-containing protein [Amycolatopsis xylanica]SDW58531.1 hypothetical protein SAMN05421504_101970 [Amycolatopsis xylanica]
MSTHSSVPPGASLPAHARDLVRMHEAVIGGARPRVPPRPLVSRSWSRALGHGLAADGINARASIPLEEVEHRRESSPLRQVIGDLGQVIDSTSMLLVVTDAQGVILWRAGSPAIRRRADSLGFSEGADWTESTVGTNAIGTALAEAAPVELLSGEHFEQNQHPWYCSASPVHDPRTGELLGVIDVSGPALTLHPAIGALVETGRRLVEAELWRHHRERLDHLRRAGEPLLAASTGPALLIDDDGWVATATGIAPGERVAAPLDGQVLAVPGLGACLPERVAGGWLVRRADASRHVRLDLELGRSPALRTQAGETGWRRAITPRHAEILTHLNAAGPAGLSAEALSRALYGDADHLVTVRAEVSRMRRLLGAIVDTRPYRLADGVVLTVLES